MAAKVVVMVVIPYRRESTADVGMDMGSLPVILRGHMEDVVLYTGM